MPGRRLWVVAAVALVALAALAFAVTVRDPLPGEASLLRTVAVTDSPWHDVWSAVAAASDLVPLVLVAVAGALATFVAGRRRFAVIALLACTVVWLVNPVLKALVARPRPEAGEFSRHLSEYSFPSGHAANSAVVVGMAVLVATTVRPRARIPAVLVGLAAVTVVAAAQLALGRHYPSDLVAGWLLALTVVAAVAGTAAYLVQPARSSSR